MTVAREYLLGSAVALILVPLSASAQDRFVEASARAVDAFLQANFADTDTCMVIGLLDEHGSRVLSAGRAGNGTDQEVGGDTVFEIGSVTKTFTSLLLLDLVRRGEMKLEDPVANYLPAGVTVPDRGGKPITLLNLAVQDSGLPFDADYVTGKDGTELEGVERWRAFNEYTVADLYEFLGKHRLMDDPGTRFLYSNVGMSLLGHVMELKTGTDYESLIVKRICDPLKMDSTRITLNPRLKSIAATGHGTDGEPAAGIALQAIAPAGALRSTANDLLAFLAANLGLRPTDLGPLMAETQIIRHTGSPELGKTAMPWYDNAVYHPPGSELLGHSGGTLGFSAFIGFDKTKRRAVVVLSNQRTLSSGGIGWAILQEMPVSREYATQLVREVVGMRVGLELDPETRILRVHTVWPDSPAGRAGLETGVTIRTINGTAVEGRSLQECLQLMSGPAGTTVRMELFDPKRQETETVELTKQKFLTVPVDTPR